MCGLVGIAGDLAMKDEKLFFDLLLFDYLRGKDSTGVAAVRGNGDIYMAKAATDPIQLSYDTRFKAAMNGASSRLFLGHNRAATRGGVNMANAHPFACDHIVGAHNGTLDWSATQDLEKALGQTFNVDSHALYAAVAQFGIEDTIAAVSGAWSLTWYDSKEKTLNFLRNDQRPMWLAYTKDFSRVLWASQWEFIHCAAMAEGYELHRDDKGISFWATDLDTMYTYDLPTLGKSKEMPKPKVKVIKGKERPAPMTGNYGGGTGSPAGFFRGGDTTQSTGTTRSGNGNSSSTTGGQSSGSNHRTKILQTSKDGTSSEPFAGLIDHDKFDEYAQHGCSFCSTPLKWGEPGHVVLESVPAILGPCCTRSPRVNRILTSVDMYM